jgi:hypothetical protein
VVNTTAEIGGALGLAVLATLSTTRSESLLADGEATASALTGGYHLAFIVGAGLAVAAIVLAVVLLRSERVAAAESEAGDSQLAYAEAG